MVAEQDYKCTKCKVLTRKMKHFYICPNCMADYATDDQMGLIERLYRVYKGNQAQVESRVRALVDGDRERLRLLLLHQANWERSMRLIATQYTSPGQRIRDILGRSGEYEKDQE